MPRSANRDGQIGDAAHNELAKNDDHLFQHFGNMDKALVGIIFHHWQGFALKGDQSYVLRVSIESVRTCRTCECQKTSSIEYDT